MVKTLAAIAMLLAALSPCDAGTRVALASEMRTSESQFFELVRSRHSIRAYERRALARNQIVEILDAAIRAPSAGNLQAYEVVVVQKAATREALAKAAFGQSFIAEAPLVLVFVTDPKRSAAKYGERGALLYSIQDAAIAASYAQLAATALHLGSVWVGAFDEDEALAAVGASPPHRAVSLLVVGYPREAPGATSRRPLSDVARSESFTVQWSR